jgi:transcriptional regulator with XRE-family HTH domain
VTGSQLRRLRRRLGLLQRELAARLGVAPNTVARWERDEVPIRAAMGRFIRLLAKTELATNSRRRS